MHISSHLKKAVLEALPTVFGRATSNAHADTGPLFTGVAMKASGKKYITLKRFCDHVRTNAFERILHRRPG